MASLSIGVQAQTEASFDGEVLKLPVVVVNDNIFTAELSISQTLPTLQLVVSSAKLLSEETPIDENSSTFLDGILTIPVVIAGPTRFSVKLKVINSSLILTFDVIEAIVINKETISETTNGIPQAGKIYILQTLFSKEENTCLEGNVIAETSTLGGRSFMDGCANVSGQAWEFTELTEFGLPGLFHITTLNPANSGQCLEGFFFDPETGAGSGAFMSNCFSETGGLFSGQIWKLIPVNGGFRLQSQFREAFNECLEGNRISEGATLEGAAFMDDCQNVTGQIWVVSEI